MSRSASGALLACVVLAATILWEVGTFTEQGIAEPPARSLVTAIAHVAPGPGTKDVAQGWLATALERPLFRENRRPLQTPGELHAPADEPTRLTGILTGPFGNRALFLTAGNPKPIVAQEGSHVGDFVVVSIEPGRAVVKSGELTRTLRPLFADGSSKPRR